MLNRDKGQFLGPFELTNLFGPSNKVVYLKKLVFQSAIRFLILFFLTDAILLKLDLQKRTPELDNSPNESCLSSKNASYIQKLEPVFDFQYKVVLGQCKFV